MDTLQIKAYAKINLCLYIPALRQDGYHELDSVFQSIGLFDYIILTKSEGIHIMCDEKSIPVDSANTCYQAAIRIMEETGAPGIAVDIEKRIPSQAGLGGGSADAAAVIAGMNRLYDCGLSTMQMQKIGAGIGADVPFFLQGGCMRAQGIGEKLSLLENPFLLDVVVVKPKCGVSTPESYKLFDQMEKTGGNALAMIAAMKSVDEAAYLKAFKNALEPCAFRLAPQSQSAVAELKQAGAMAAQVTGSGSAVFGLFKKGEGIGAKQKIKAMDFEQVFSVDMKHTGLSF